jgi:hypothetical protein
VVQVTAGNDQVCVGGLIFDWSDEYWKGNNANLQVGGPDLNFQGGSFAGGYADEAGYGLSSSVPNSQYGSGQPNIVRTFFKAYNAVTTLVTPRAILAGISECIKKRAVKLNSKFGRSNGPRLDEVL